MSDAGKPLILVDGSSYLYRAFHALPPLVNSRGEPTGAIYGVASMLKKIIADYAPLQFAVVFDSKEKTFRHALYSAYKANRAVMPEELQAQIEPLHALIRAMGIPVIIVPGVEADDVIGTLAKKACEKKQKVVISTGDKDMAQLVNANITLINTMNQESLDETGVLQKFGVKPVQIIDYLALVGDSSDNIKGIPGVGPKTAAKWLTQYDTLDNLVTHANSITGKIGDSFRAEINHLAFTKTLLTIKCDVDLPDESNCLDLKTPSTENLINLLKQLEFKHWLSELSNTSSVETSKLLQKNYICVDTEKKFEELINQCKKTALFAFDTETTSLNIITAAIVGFSFAFESQKAYYLPLAHDYPGAPEQLDFNNVLKQLKPILENPALKKICHHAKYDKNICRNHGIELQGIQFDTMLESYVFDSTATRHDMDSLALKYLNKQTIHFEDIAGKGSKQITFNQVAVNDATEYAAEDADITLQLHKVLWPKIEQNPGLKKTFEHIEMPLALVLADMERYGVLINASALKQQSSELSKRILAIEQEAYEMIGQKFNLASPKQLQAILYDKLGLPILERTPSGQPSTAENVLQELANQYQLPSLILEHRTLSKLKTTYTDKLPEQIHPKTGRVHTSYQQAVASTGRLSSANPNLQNIPIRTSEGRQIRKAFIAPENYKIMAFDYSQIELRLMAHLSQDKSLLQAFSEGVDIHLSTASDIFHIARNSVSTEQRRRAKAINFGLMYGMSAFGLSRQIGVERAEAQHYIDTYFKEYPAVKAYMENTCALAHRQGFVTTLFGRQLHLPDINARNKTREKAAERAAINAPLQGSAADLIKIAMIQIAAWLKEAKVPARMIMQVHDELVFEVHEQHTAGIGQKIKFLMENAVSLSVPLIVSVGTGTNWDEAH